MVVLVPPPPGYVIAARGGHHPLLERFLGVVRSYRDTGTRPLMPHAHRHAHKHLLDASRTRGAGASLAGEIERGFDSAGKVDPAAPAGSGTT